MLCDRVLHSWCGRRFRRRFCAISPSSRVSAPRLCCGTEGCRCQVPSTFDKRSETTSHLQHRMPVQVPLHPPASLIEEPAGRACEHIGGRRSLRLATCAGMSPPHNFAAPWPTSDDDNQRRGQLLRAPLLTSKQRLPEMYMPACRAR